MPKSNIIVKNVFEAIAGLPDGTSRFMGCLTSSGISKTVNTEDIRCGINGDLKTILQLDSDMTITLNTAVWNDYFMEMNSGSEFELAQTLTVKTYEEVDFTASTLDAVGEMLRIPVGGIVEVQDNQGKVYEATFLTGDVTVTGGAATLAGTKALVLFTEEVTADMLDLRSDVLPQVFELTLHAIAYDAVDGGAVLADLYFHFPRVQPEGSMDMSTATSTNTQNEIVFRVLPVSGSFGTYMAVERA